MRTTAIFGLMLAVAIAAFSSGVATGFFQGLQAHAIIDGIPRGVLAIANLRALESGKTEAIKLELEGYVNYALGAYPYMQERWWYPLFKSGWLIVDPNDYKTYIERIATYRKAHTSRFQEHLTPPAGIILTEDEKQMYVEIKKHQERADTAVARYAK